MAVPSLAKVAQGNLPGTWNQGIEQTMRELKQYFRYEDDLIDHINASTRGLENELRCAAVWAIAATSGRQARQTLEELTGDANSFVASAAREALHKFHLSR
jgi:hypothetical protein